MKHLLVFLLIFVLILLSIFVLLCLHLSFDDSPAVTAHFCRAHGLFAIKLTLPEELLDVGEAFSAAIAALPEVITAPPKFLFCELGNLLYGIRAAYRAETAGCTAFS